MFDLRANLDRIPNIKPSYNIGALLDIPTGKYVRGKYNESVLNGGLSSVTGIVGIGNNFKSTIMHYMQLSAMAKFEGACASTYDTEVNITEDRLKTLVSSVDGLENEDIIDNGRWIITDKTKYHGNEWFEKIKDYMDEKIKNAKSITSEIPFLDRDGKTLLTMLTPTFTEIDSLTKFETESSYSMQEDNELGDSGANTLYMKEGQAKKRLLSYLPKPASLSNNYFLISAHVGKDIPMDPRAAPVKKLQFLKNNDVLKGVTADFTFLTTNCWQCQNAIPLMNDSTKGPEYPRDTTDNLKGDTDLFVVTLVQLRSKVGPSGLILRLIVSQREGVLSTLTEFHYIKENGRYGLDGTLQNYNLDLYPEAKLSRTAIRGKIKNDPRLRRAINITAEMSQINQLWHDLPEELYCTPKQLYEDLTKLGFDMNVLLDTRGWWTINNDKHEVPFLSTMDLMRMRLPEDNVNHYFPYWLSKTDKKTIIKKGK